MAAETPQEQACTPHWMQTTPPKERSQLTHLRIVDEKFDQLLNGTIVAEQPACYWCSACGALLVPGIDGPQDALLAEAV